MDAKYEVKQMKTIQSGWPPFSLMVREEPFQGNPWKTEQENGKKWKLVPQEKTTLLVFRGASERERVYPVAFTLSFA